MSGSNRGFQVGSGNGTIEVANGTTEFEIAGLVGGAGRLTKAGPGTLRFSSNSHSYAGGVTVNQGVLSVGFVLGLGAEPASPVANQVALNGGTLRYTNTISSASTGVNRGFEIGAVTEQSTLQTQGLLYPFQESSVVLGGLLKSVQEPWYFPMARIVSPVALLSMKVC